MTRSHNAQTNLNPTFLAMLRAAHNGFNASMREARRKADSDRAKVLKRLKPRLDARRAKIMVAAREEALSKQMDGVAAAKQWLKVNHPELVPKPKPRAPSAPPRLKSMMPTPAVEIAPPVPLAPIETRPMPTPDNRPTHRAKPSKARLEPALEVSDSECRRRMLNMRASIMHLVDLKRAGHTAAVTEHRIGHDARSPRVFRPECAMSLYSSSANMCAEL